MSEANPPETERGEGITSYGPGTYHSRGRQPPQSRQFIFAIQPLNGASHLIHVTLQETDRGGLIFYHARTSIARAAAERWYKKLLAKIFTKCSVGTAKVHQVMLCEDETSRVYLRDFTKDMILTEAFYNPRVVFRSTDTGHERSLLDTPSIPPYEDLRGQEIIVFRQIIDKASVAWVLILLLIASPGLGIAIGLCSHNADAGIAASAGIFALASFIQGLVAWLQE